ncbi:MAG: Efflux transporter periplasmic adaptor subunit [Ignavibacteria bacterium]|nr:Efflux transporter periplasmic adaptor subunit [Ignavibacteria bacterium]
MAKKKSKKKAIVIISILVLIGIITTVAVIQSSKEKSIKVTIDKVSKRTITQSVAATGKVEPETEVKISSQTSGEIIFLGVQEGDKVRNNQLLVRINPDIIETQVEQFKAGADAAKMEIEARLAEKERAEAEFSRIIELYKKEFVSKQDFDRSKTTVDQAISGYKSALSRYEQAEAGFKQIQRSMNRTSIFSPISGVCTKLSIEKGEKVVGTEMMAGTEMMKISDLTVMNAVVDVDENDIVLVKVDDPVKIEIDAYPDRVFPGKVIEIGHSAKTNQLGTQDAVTNFSVKIRILEIEASLRPGMSCNAEIETQTKENVLSVPLQAVTIRDTKKEDATKVDEDDHGVRQDKSDKEKKQKTKRPQSVVFKKNGNKVKMVNVETGISDNGYIEITSGLKEKEEIVSGSFQAVSRELNDESEIRVDSTNQKSKKTQNEKKK